MGPQAQTATCSAGTHTHKTHGDLALGLLADMSGGLGGAPRTPVAQACRQCQLGTHTRPQIAVFGLSQSVIRSTHICTPRDGQGCTEKAAYNRPSLLHAAELLLWPHYAVGLAVRGSRVVYPGGVTPE